MPATKHRARFHVALVIAVFLFGAASAAAHPMGNFSVNRYGSIKLGQTTVEILYLIDMAEIPTYQEMRQFGMTTKPDDPRNLGYLAEQEARLKAGLAVEIDGRIVDLDSDFPQMAFADGAGGLPTMKLSFVFRGKLGVLNGTHKLSYADNNFPGRAGWKEIVILGEGPTILGSTAPSVDRSHELTNYSSDLLNSPPQQLSAAVTFETRVSEAGRERSQADRYPAHAPQFQTSAIPHPIASSGRQP